MYITLPFPRLWSSTSEVIGYKSLQLWSVESVVVVTENTKEMRNESSFKNENEYNALCQIAQCFYDVKEINIGIAIYLSSP